MREFISVMAGKSEQEIADAVVNVRISKKHFDEALKKVKGSMDRESLEVAERQAWEILYNQEQRTILENAVAALKQAEIRTGKTYDTEPLRKATFARRKDWNEIKKLTHKLEEELKA